MSKEELLAELLRLQECLVDIADERDFFIGQTNLHIGNRRIADLREEWEYDEESLHSRIIAVEVLLEED